MSRGLALLAAFALVPGVAHAQGYRLTVDSRIQSVSYRGVAIDSVAATAVDTATDGSLFGAGGYAVRCAGGAYCMFFRPGPLRRGGPLVTTADGAWWGLGVPGLSFRGNVRLGVELGDADVWPGATPAVQLIEGYAEYATASATAELGRTIAMSRLGYTGFDGAKVLVRGLGGAGSAGVYGGWGLARAVAIPVTSAALDPLDDFQPRDRQYLLGLETSWTASRWSARAVYERQLSQATRAIVSERAGVDGTLRIIPGLSLTGGADYDLAVGTWGTAELALDVVPSGGLVTASLGGRRYRPYFDLWTIWGAFNPVAYHAVTGAITVHPMRDLRLRGSGEAYQYDPTETATPLADVRDHGWRWSAGANYAPLRAWLMDLSYTVDQGPGASAAGLQGVLRWLPRNGLAVTAQFATLDRPLEFRYNQSSLLEMGVSADWAVNDRVRLDAGAASYSETRNRPDPAAFDWSQWRIHAGVRLGFGNGADRQGLPPAVLAMPERGRR